MIIRKNLYDFSENVFTNGFKRDANRLANRPLFKNFTWHRKQYSNFRRSDGECDWANDAGELTAKINSRLFECLKSFGIWSDHKKLRNLVTIDFKSIEEDNNLRKNYEIDNNLKELIVFYFQKNIEYSVKLDRAKFHLSEECIDRVHQIRDIYDADHFLDDFGTHFPICEYLYKEYLFHMVKISSYVICHKREMTENAKVALQFLQQNKTKLENPYRVYFNLRNRAGNPDKKADYRIDSIGEQPSHPTCIKFWFYQPANGKYVDWQPMWRILASKKHECNLSDRTLDLIRHAWHLRERNFLNKNNFALQRLESLIERLNYFDLEEYWQESIYKLIREKYFDFYVKNPNINETILEKYLDTAFRTVLETYESHNLAYFMKNDLLFLSASKNLLEFIDEQSEKGTLVFLLCYSNDLIASTPDGWFDFLEKFCEKLLEVGDTFKRLKQKNSIGLLVNYDLHPYLAKLETFKDFYNKYFLINNYFADNSLEKNDFDQEKNETNEVFIEENEPLLNDFERMKLSSHTSTTSTTKIMSTLENLSKLESILKTLSQQKSVSNVRNLLKNNQRDLEAITSYLKRDQTSHVFNPDLHRPDYAFSSFIRQLGVENLYFPIRINSNENDFYKSISIIMYGTSNLWPLIKIGILFVYYKYSEFFDEILRDRNERFSSSDLLFDSCKDDHVFDDYVQRALLILLERPIYYACICNNAQNGYFRKNVNYFYPETNANSNEKHSRSVMHLIGRQLSVDDGKKFSYSPLLPLDQNTSPI